jgi:uncharacterized protein
LNIVLTEIEARVLGSLLEKDVTTPDYYPLSLNALVNACNQKNNREPVMALDEEAVRPALEGLHEKRLAGPASGADSRVTKYEHRLQEVFNFTRGESAILCVLLLRGPQTPGELRGRGERMHRFDGLDEVESTLQRLTEHDPPLVRVLPRQPGTKESRYMHLFSGDAAAADTEHADTSELGKAAQSGSSFSRSQASTPDAGRISQLEHNVASLERELSELKREVGDLKEDLANFKRQF